MSEVRLDGHTWTDRGDGLYIPDEQYEVRDLMWCLGPEYEGKDFVVVRNKDLKNYSVVAMVCNWDSIEYLWKYRDELNTQGIDAHSIGGQGNTNMIGGCRPCTF